MAWLAVIAWCTLQPIPGQAADVAALPWYCIVCGDAGGADVLLNILLFLPLGAILHALDWPLRRTLPVVMAMSIGIEVSQGLWLPGRDACLGDVLSNTTGGTLGWLSYPLIVALTAPTIRLARRGTIVVLVTMAAVWIATGAALQPSLTDQVPWIGQPIQMGRGRQPFPGTLQQSTFNGIRVPNEAMDSTPHWRDSIAVEIDATRRTDSLYSGVIVMLRILDSARTPLVAIDQIGDAARVRLRLRGNDWKLHSVRWLVDHSVRMSPRQPWRFRWQWLGDRFTIASQPMDGPGNALITVPLSIGLGWAFIHPFVSVIGSNRTLWTALWIGWWFGLLGWLAGPLDRRARWLAGAIAITLFVGASIVWGLRVQGQRDRLCGGGVRRAPRRELVVVAGASLK